MFTTFIPRRDRALFASRRASDAVRAQGGTAMEAAMAAIDAGCGPKWEANYRKRRVEAIIAKGFDHPEVRARYSAYALLLTLPIAQAAALVESDHRRLKDETARRTRIRPPRLPAMVADELRIITRWLRRYRAEAWDVAREPIPQAAE